MSAFLEKIHAITKTRVAAAQLDTPLTQLQDMPLYARAPRPVRPAFSGDGIHIIAEVKFASPSEGQIHTTQTAPEVAAGYAAAGAAMLSVLTEPEYFKGSLDIFRAVRNALPETLLLRKDFITDPYQLHEARACGADAVLLIVAMTGETHTADLLSAARALNLTPLVEVHDKAELDIAVSIGADMIGVNNRNLKTLAIDLDTGRQLAQDKPENATFICESGLSTPQDVVAMRHAGYDGFLIGSHFMRSQNPGAALRQFMNGF